MILNKQKEVELLWNSSKDVLRECSILISDKTCDGGKELLDIDAHSFDPFVFGMFNNKLYIFACIDKDKDDNTTPLYANNNRKRIHVYIADYRNINGEIIIANIIDHDMNISFFIETKMKCI
jgi:hypothetical protein